MCNVYVTYIGNVLQTVSDLLNIKEGEDMKRTMSILVIATVLFAGAAMVAMAFPGQGPQSNYGTFGVCPMGGPLYAGYGYTSATDVTVPTLEEAFEIAIDQIDPDVPQENIYQMGRGWVVSYVDEDGMIGRSFIDALSGEIFEVPSGGYGYSAYNADGYQSNFRGHGMGYRMGGYF